MTATSSTGKSILRWEAFGFSLMMIISWLAEIIQIPHLLYGEPADFNWLRIFLRSVVILAVWAWVHFTSRRLLKRLHELEEFLLICSWCRKVGHDGQWLSMEDYFDSRLNTETSHGICPACAAQQLASHHKATRVVRTGS